ncbi:MAG: response regulator [Phycisphaerae bacterium]|nr:response regulator [Phycisphaerae bacterium]
MSARRARVLDVGNCDPDHAMIRGMLERHFDVEVDRVMFVDEALARMREQTYDLVLVNRLIFEDGSEGIQLHRQAKAEPALAAVPIMMISNFEAAQSASVAAGGIPGFGKAAVTAPETKTLLARYLPTRA